MQPPPSQILQPRIPHTPHLNTRRHAYIALPLSPVTRSRCLSVQVMTRVYQYAYTWACVCKCISRWHNAMALNLTSPRPRGSGAVTPGTSTRKQILMRAAELQVYVCECVFTVFLSCRGFTGNSLFRSGTHHANQSTVINWLCNWVSHSSCKQKIPLVFFSRCLHARKGFRHLVTGDERSDHIAGA